MRKIIGLNEGMGEAEEVDLSKVNNPNAYTDDIINYNAERGGDDFDEEDSTRISMIAMSMLSDIQEEAPEMSEKINMIKRLIMKMNDKTEISQSELDAVMQGLDEGELFEGSRSSQYDDSHGSPYDRGWADKYYGRPMDPHKYLEGTYKGEKITDLTPEELKAYEAGYENCDDQKDWG